MIQAFFYIGETTEVPLGERAYWINVVPRRGEIVTVSYYPSGQTTGQRHLTGEVINVQWTFEPSDSNDRSDLCTVDITLRDCQTRLWETLFMKEATVEELKNDVRGFQEAAQRERILVTDDGKPLAVVVGIENKDREDLRLEASPDFCDMIEERRRQPTVLLKDVKAELLSDGRRCRTLAETDGADTTD